VSIDEELRQVIEMLVNKYEVYGVVLFGSRVRGDYKPWSDYDLLIIGSFDKPYPERLEEVMEVLSSTRLHVEPHPYTLGEVSAMLQRMAKRVTRQRIVSALREGVILYKTEKLMEMIKKLIEEVPKSMSLREEDWAKIIKESRLER